MGWRELYRRTTTYTGVRLSLLLEALRKLQEDETVDWTQEAKCAETDPEVFFPETMFFARFAIEICQVCPVMDQCLNEALSMENPQGVWGGVDFTSRNKSSKARVNEAIRLRRSGLSPKAVDAEIRKRSTKNRWG